MRYTALLAVCLTSLFGQGCRRQRPERRWQESLVRRYRQVRSEARAAAIQQSRKQGSDLQHELTRFDNDKNSLLPPPVEVSIRMVLQQDLLPVPIREGKFDPLPRFTTAPVLTKEQQALILEKSRSVGRLELRTGGQFTPLGTAFVVARRDSSGIIATNCHVIRRFIALAQNAVSGVNLPANVQINFGDTPVHNDFESFQVGRLLPCPGKALDVAFLEVSNTSVMGNKPLPEPLNLLQTAFADNFPEIQMGVIGYPNLAKADPNDDFSRIFAEFDGTKYAKFYCPGQVTDHRIAENVDFLLDVASTMQGESGSPLLRLDDRTVIGVHTCCSSTDEGFENPNSKTALLLPCAWRPIPAPKNLSVSSWTVTSDRQLSSLLRQPSH